MQTTQCEHRQYKYYRRGTDDATNRDEEELTACAPPRSGLQRVTGGSNRERRAANERARITVTSSLFVYKLSTFCGFINSE